MDIGAAPAIFSFVLIVFGQVQGTLGYCNVTAIDECASQIVPAVGEIFNRITTDRLDESFRSTLFQMCRDLDDSNLCLYLEMIRCSDESDFPELRIAERIFDYICHFGGKYKLTSEVNCWHKVNLEMELNQCEIQMQETRAMWDENEEGGMEEEDVICQTFNSMDECMVNRIKRRGCSDEAAGFVGGLMSHIASPFIRRRCSSTVMNIYNRREVHGIKSEQGKDSFIRISPHKMRRFLRRLP